MPNAIQTNSTLAALWSEQNFIDKMMLTLKAAGFPATPYDYHPGADSGTNRYVVYEFVGDSSKAKGRIYLRIRWSVNAVSGAITIVSGLFDTWSVANRTGTNMGTEITCSLIVNPMSAVDFYSFSHPEIKHLVMNQGSSWGYLNFIKPANKITIGTTTLFEESLYPYGFISAAGDLSTLYGVVSTLSPSGVDNFYYNDRPGELANKNAATNRVQVIPAPRIYGSSNQGVFAQFSTDVGISASNGMVNLTEVNDTIRRVLLIPRSFSGIVLNCDPNIVQG